MALLVKKVADMYDTYRAYLCSRTLDQKEKNHSTQDSRVVPHHGTNWAALWLTAQIGRDAVLSESYGRGWEYWFEMGYTSVVSL